MTKTRTVRIPTVDYESIKKIADELGIRFNAAYEIWKRRKKWIDY